MSCTIKIDHLQIIVLGNVHYQLWPVCGTGPLTIQCDHSPASAARQRCRARQAASDSAVDMATPLLHTPRNAAE